MAKNQLSVEIFEKFPLKLELLLEYYNFMLEFENGLKNDPIINLQINIYANLSKNL